MRRLLCLLAGLHECCHPIWSNHPDHGYHSSVKVHWWCLHVQGTLGRRLARL